MKSGKMRDRVTIQYNVPVIGDDNERVPSWLNYETNVPAEVKNISESELNLSEQVIAEATHEIRIRWKQLTSKNRFTFEGLVYEILGITNPDGRRRELVCVCKSAGEPDAVSEIEMYAGMPITLDNVGTLCDA